MGYCIFSANNSTTKILCKLFQLVRKNLICGKTELKRVYFCAKSINLTWFCPICPRNGKCYCGLILTPNIYNEATHFQLTYFQNNSLRLFHIGQIFNFLLIWLMYFNCTTRCQFRLRPLAFYSMPKTVIIFKVCNLQQISHVHA